MKCGSTFACLGLASLLLACEPNALNEWIGSASGAARPSEADADLVSLDSADVMQVYYQFVDDAGRVRFVSTLDAVPAAWRDRVGFVEMSTPPPLSPGDAQRVRREQMARMTTTSNAAAPTSRVRGAPEIILYGAAWCGACRRAKQYLDSEGIDYVERDVDERRWAEEMYAKAGRGGIPVFDVNGQILRGFSPQRLEQLIESAS